MGYGRAPRAIEPMRVETRRVAFQTEDGHAWHFVEYRSSRGIEYTCETPVGGEVAWALNMVMTWDRWVGLLILDMLGLEALDVDSIVQKIPKP